MEHLRFLVEAAKHREVASVAPTSRVSVRHICRDIPTDRPCVVVEFGPGTGAFTRHLLDWIHPESHLIAIELHEGFAKDLEKFARSRSGGCRFDPVCGDARDVSRWLTEFGYERADFIVSGIPFSLLEPPLREQIVQQACQCLADDGELLVYQCSFMMKKLLRHYFERVHLSRSLFNLPPLCVMRCWDKRQVCGSELVPSKNERKA